MTLYSYGKILDVDLASGKIVRRDIEPEFARTYIGGMGFGCRILYDEVGMEVEPFSPHNIVVFATGPLTGTSAPCGARTEVTTKSALTGHIGTGNTGGNWGTLLKRAGIALIVVRNASSSPVYLRIDDGVAELRPANHLWGKDTRETSNQLREELAPSAPSTVSVLTIGPAGENLVRYACPLNDFHHVAARSTAGAVMGAKKLKAIAVRGTGEIKMARPEEFKRAAKEARERLLAAHKAATMRGFGHNTLHIYAERGCLPGKNFQTGVLPDFLETRGPAVQRKYITGPNSVCHACPTPCFNLAEVNEGKYAGVKVNRAQHPGVVVEWGGKCAISYLPAIWKCKETCQELGMDYVSTAGVIAFAMELFQRGIITTKDTDGLELTWGNDDAIIPMIHKIASRDGFGDILAQGSVRAAATIGRGAEKYVMVIKGLEKMTSDPRSGRPGWSFGDLTNPRGGDNVKNTHFSADLYHANWWLDKFDMPEEIKRRIYSMPPEQVTSTWEGKPLMCRWFEDVYSLANALGICLFAQANVALGPTFLSRLYSASTGWDSSPDEIMKSAERVFTVLKAYTIRQGLSRKDDTWPDRFFTEPLPEGPSKGAVLSRTAIDRLLDEYYELRGWDKKSGLPTRQKMAELGLSDMADELTKLGKLPR